MKFILDDIRLTIDTLVENANVYYYQKHLYDIIFFIQSRNYIEYGTDNGVTITDNQFKNKLNLSDKKTIDKYIKLLIDHNIIWRSKTSYENNINVPYRYAIHWNMLDKITNLTHFIYESSIQFSTIKDS